MRLRPRVFTILTFFLTALGLEITVRVFQRVSGIHFQGLVNANCQAIYFAGRSAKDPFVPGPKFYDPGLGWRNASSFHQEGWRSPQPSKVKSKIRVALLGDSFTVGDNLTDHETVLARLQGELGSSFEVLNFAVSGFSLAQMALVADQVLPQYAPDYVIVPFIADDLRRTCLRCMGGIERPSYYLEGGVLKAAGVPVPLPEQLIEEHQRPLTWFSDRVVALVSRSRLLQALSEPYYLYRRNQCLYETNLAVFKNLETKLGLGSKVLFVHLQGVLPSGFEESLKRELKRYVSMPAHEASLGKTLGIVPGLIDGYHPDAAATKIHAHVYASWIRLNEVP